MFHRNRNPATSYSSDSDGELPSQYQSKNRSCSRTDYKSKDYDRTRYIPSPCCSHASTSWSRKHKTYGSRSDSSSDNIYKKSKNSIENGRTILKVFKPSKSRLSYSDYSSDTSSPERLYSKKRYVSSSSDDDRYRKRKYNKSPCSSPIKNGSSKEITENMFSKSTLFESSTCNNPSTSSSSYLMKNLIHSKGIIQQETTVTTTYKTELQQFSSIVKHSRNGESHKDCDSDDSLSRLDLSVYDDNNEDMTKKRPGGDIYHTFYIHPEDGKCNLYYIFITCKKSIVMVQQIFFPSLSKNLF